MSVNGSRKPLVELSSNLLPPRKKQKRTSHIKPIILPPNTFVPHEYPTPKHNAEARVSENTEPHLVGTHEIGRHSTASRFRLEVLDPLILPRPTGGLRIQVRTEYKRTTTRTCSSRHRREPEHPTGAALTARALSAGPPASHHLMKTANLKHQAVREDELNGRDKTSK